MPSTESRIPGDSSDSNSTNSSVSTRIPRRPNQVPPGLSIAMPTTLVSSASDHSASDNPTPPIEHPTKSIQYYSNLADRQSMLRVLANNESDYHAKKSRLADEYATKLHAQFRETLSRHAITTRKMRETKASLFRLQDRVRDLSIANAMQGVHVSVLERRLDSSELSRSKLRDMVNSTQERLAQQETNIECLRRRTLCVVCYEASVDTLIVQCGHLVLCSDCEARIRATESPKCPICRVAYTGSTDVLKVILP